MATVTINPGDSAGDIAVLINAALADPAVTRVVLGAGLFVLHSPIFVPSNKTLEGAGRDSTVLQVAGDFARSFGEGEGVVNSEYGATAITLHGFTVDAAKAMPDGFRLSGVFMRQATGFAISEVDVHNATGYAHFAQGDAANFTNFASGTYEDCWVYNSQIGFEQMACDGVTLTNVHARDGDGDLVGTYFHPLTGSKNITYIDCTGYGRASVGFDLTANVRALENISIINCDVEITGSTPAFYAGGPYGHYNLVIEGSRFVSHNEVAMLVLGVIATIRNTYIRGEAIGLVVYQAADGTLSQVTAIDSTVIGMRDPAQQAAAYGIGGGGGTVHWEGGVIEARGAPGLNFLFGAGGITYSETTQLVTSGFHRTTVYSENGAALDFAPPIAIPDPAASYAGARLLVTYDAWNTAADRLSVIPGGSIAVDGTDILRDGIVVAEFSGGEAGTDLSIGFVEGATGGDVAAVLAAIGFRNLSDDPATQSRTLSFRLVQASGAVDEANAAIVVRPVDDAATLDLAGASPSFTENGEAVAVAPAALLADVDADRLPGGTLTVSIAAGGAEGDLILILAAAAGPGAISVSGDVVSYGDTAIGTLAGGTGPDTPLVVSLNAEATLAAVEALVRAIGYASLSDDPGTARTLVFTLRAVGGAETVAAVEVAIFPLDDPTVARDDAFDAAEDAPLVLDLLANDDPDGAASPIAAVDGTTLAPGESVTLASGAAVTLLADGTLRYDPSRSFEALAAGDSGTDGFAYTLANGTGAVVTIAVAGAADAPVITGGAVAGWTEGDPPVAILPGATVTDVDSPSLAGGTLTAAFAATVAEGDSLSILATAEIALDGDTILYQGTVVATFAGGGAAALVVSFGPAASPAAAEAVLRAIAFASGSDAPAATRDIRFTLTDGDGGAAEPLLATVAATGVNDAPALTGLAASVALTEGDAPAAILAGARIADPDSADLAGGRLALSFEGAAADDRLEIVAGNGIAIEELPGGGTAILLDGTVIATAAGALGTAGFDLLLTAAATPAAIEALLAAILYSNASDAPAAERTLRLVLSDGDGGETGTLLAIAVAAVDDPAAAQDDSAATDEASSVAIAPLANDTDPDGPVAAIAAISGTAVDPGGTVILASGARVTLNADGTLDYDPSGALAWLTGPGSGAANSSLVDSFTYTLADGAVATVRVTVAGLASAGDELHGSAGADLVLGTAGADLFRLDQGGDDRAEGGAGNDAFLFGAALTAADEVDGGEGSRDQLGLQGDYDLTFGDRNLTGIETLALLSGTDTRFGGDGNALHAYVLRTVDANVAAGATLVVNMNDLRAGESVRFDGSAERDGSFFFYGGAGADHLVGGAKGDSFFFGDGLFAATDSVVGGDGAERDQLGLRGNYTLVFAAGTMSGIETLALVSGKDTRFGGAGPDYSYDITLHDDNVAAGAVLSVNAADLGAGERLVFDGSADTDGSFRLVGGHGADRFTGGANADIIYGGGGQDRLAGGGGADSFFYRSAAESSGASFDILEDFDFAVDRLELPGVHDSFGLVAAGSLSLASFDSDLAAALGAALTAGHALFFTPTEGDLAGRLFLVVDQNGKAGYQSGEDFVFEFANPTPPPLPPTDFLV